MKSLLLLVAAIFLSASAFGQNTADDLKKQFTAIQAAINTGKKDDAASLTKALLPDAARLKKALSDQVPEANIAKVLEMYAGLTKNPAAVGMLLAVPSARSEVKVHAATTEEIAKYADGSVAFNEFPGGAKNLATSGTLRPGVTFYEVEATEPGKSAGTKFHLFYFDGAGWAMLGPVWRVLK
jgi:sortase (surface protein transpeptidase)